MIPLAKRLTCVILGHDWCACVGFHLVHCARCAKARP